MQNDLIAKQLRGLLYSGMTTAFAVTVAAQIPSRELLLIVLGDMRPCDEQAEKLERLLSNYRIALRAVNAESLRTAILRCSNEGL